MKKTRRGGSAFSGDGVAKRSRIIVVVVVVLSTD
jgi:hypothetical protein